LHRRDKSIEEGKTEDEFWGVTKKEEEAF